MKVFLKNVRLSFPSLFHASAYEEGSKPAYRAAFIIAPGSENDKNIRAAIEEAAKEKWGAKAPNKLKAYEGSKTQFCYRNGDLMDREEYEGAWILAAKRSESKGPPAVVGRGGRGDVLTESSGKPYGGCYVNATVETWAQDGSTPGLRCTLLGVQFISDGEPFGGSLASDEDFEDLTVDDAADDFGFA